MLLMLSPPGTAVWRGRESGVEVYQYERDSKKGWGLKEEEEV